MSLLGWTSPHYIQHGSQTKVFLKKATLSDFGRINSVPDGETAQKSAKPYQRNAGEFVPYSRTCARRSAFTGDFSKTAERISTRLSRQTADGGWQMDWNEKKNVWLKLLKSVGV